jgi:hypothetical protein
VETLLFRSGLEVKRKGGLFGNYPVDTPNQEQSANDKVDGKLTLLPFESLSVLFLVSLFFSYHLLFILGVSPEAVFSIGLQV